MAAETASPALPGPGVSPHDAHLAALASVINRYGTEWQVIQDPDTGVWTAVQRPTPTALRVLVGHTLAELDERLAAAAREADWKPSLRPSGGNGAGTWGEDGWA